MKHLLFGILLLIALIYSAMTMAIGPERDTRTAILTLQQITTPSNPPSGFNRIYSKGDDKLYTLNSAGDEVELGAGGGGASDFSNLYIDPSFEEDVTEGTCTSCTATQETSASIVEVTPTNLAALKIAFLAATGDWTGSTKGTTQSGAAQGLFQLRIRNDSDQPVDVYPNVDGIAQTGIKCTIPADDKWTTCKTPFVMGSTSASYTIATTASTTGNIYADKLFIGEKSVTGSLAVETNWADYDVTVGAGFGTVTSKVAKWRRVGENMEVEVAFVLGTAAAALGTFSLPSGYTVDESRMAILTPSTSSVVGEWKTNNASTLGTIVYVTSSGNIAMGGTYNNANMLGHVNVNSFIASSVQFMTKFSVPIEGWDATTDTYLAANPNEVTTKILASDVTSTGDVAGLQFSGLTIGATYAISGSLFMEVNNGEVSGNIRSAASGAGDIYAPLLYLDQSSSRTANAVSAFFTATSTDAYFNLTNSGVALYGNGTKAETFLQIKRVDSVINATFKDVVTTPDSSNGKPVVFSFEVTTTSGAVARNYGGFVTSCTAANPTVCTFTGLNETPNCAATPRGGSAQDVVEFNAQSASSITIRSYLSTSGGLVASVPVNVICHGTQL